MNLIALFAIALLALTSACSTTSRQIEEAAVCTPANPDSSLESERDGLDRDYIACVINRDAVSPARTCYENTFTEPGYTTDPVRVITKFQIGVDGHVTNSDATSDRGGDSLPKCVKAAMKNLNFAKPFGSVPVKVSYPFVFKRSGLSSGGRETIWDNF